MRTLVTPTVAAQHLALVVRSFGQAVGRHQEFHGKLLLRWAQEVFASESQVFAKRGRDDLRGNPDGGVRIAIRAYARDEALDVGVTCAGKPTSAPDRRTMFPTSKTRELAAHCPYKH